MEHDVIPIKFEAEIGGFFGGYCEVKLRKGTLFYSRGMMCGERAEIRPTPEEWAEFRRSIDQIDVWKWLREYGSQACDGTQWSLKIKYHDRFINAEGSNAYPGAEKADENHGTMTVEFLKYLAAVKKLIGGRDFE